jgi:hypothetical protein
MVQATDITGLLRALGEGEGEGEEAARTRRVAAVYDELRRLARGFLHRELFGGLSVEEAAAVPGVAPITLKRDWARARAWLYRGLRGQPT